MSGFLKRNTTNTVNPAGGVNPASTPNVGQYGWTSYDAANVNQLIQYVNMAQEAANSAKDSADYVESRYVEIQKVINYLEEVWKEVGPVLGDITNMYNNVTRLHNEVVTMHTDTRTWMLQAEAFATEAHNSATESREEAVKSEASAEASAASAAASEISNKGSEDWYNKAKDLYDDLKEGQVYQGTWNPMTNAYPVKPSTNSVWDVSLPSGTSSHMFDNKEWRSGDRLLFALVTDMFEQLAVGGGVDSINGKTGAVTLTATEIGAFPSTGGTLAGDLTVTKAVFFENDKQYVSTAYKNVYVAAAEGRVYIQGTSNPAARVNGVDSYIYHQGFKPTAAEVGAVGLSGAQTMTGQLNGVKFTATDSYALVSKLRPYQGVYLGNNDNDKRTIIGGGGNVVGDATGSVHLRPNGITDTAGEVIIRPTGQVSTSAAPVDNSHLTNKVYVDGQIKIVDDKIAAIGPDAINAMPKSGGTFTGQVSLAPATMGALIVSDKASIMYRDGAGSWMHQQANGNSIRWAHGSNADNTMAELFSGGEFHTQGPQYSLVGQITRSRGGSNGGTWLALEAVDEGAPYISSKVNAENNPVIAMRFGRSEVSVESGKRMAAGEFRVANDGGLKFAPTNDISGITWAMGINNSTRTLGFNRYVDGGYTGTPFLIDSAGATTIDSLAVNQSVYAGYFQCKSGSNNIIEFHQPGVSAVMVYKPQNSPALRIAQSNGAGGEASMYASIDGDTAYFKGRPTTMWGQGRTWGQSGLSRFYAENVNLSQGMLGSLASQWVTVPGIVAYEQGIGFISDQSGVIGNYGHTLFCQDGGSYLKYWIFRNNGGQQSPSGFRIDPDGRMAGKAYEGYDDHFHWATTSLGTVSDARLKTVLGETTKSAVDVVNQFQFKRFVWNEKAGKVYHERASKITEIGLIAQQVESVDSSLVKTVSVGGDTLSDTKTLDTAAMLALAMKAIQEQQVQINELKEKLNEFILK